MEGKKMFKHAPFEDPQKEIRLASIIPGSDPIEIVLKPIQLQLIEYQYEAISYEWGTDLENYIILVNGEQFLTRHNLWELLHHISHSDIVTSTDKFWIDAICINQTDTIEKNHQVQMMGQIYGKAKQVLSWLGDSSKNATIGRKFVDWVKLKSSGVEFEPAEQYLGSERFSAQVGKTRVLDYGIFSAWRNAWKMFLAKECSPAATSDHRKLKHEVSCILRNSYFKRLWITQEVILAQFSSIILGSALFEMQSTLGPMSDYSSGSVPGVMIYRGADVCAREPVILFSTFRAHLCADRRDFIYGLRSIIDRGENITVDYSLHTEMLFLDVLKCLAPRSAVEMLTWIEVISYTMMGLQLNADSVSHHIKSRPADLCTSLFMRSVAILCEFDSVFVPYTEEIVGMDIGESVILHRRVGDSGQYHLEKTKTVTALSVLPDLPTGALIVFTVLNSTLRILAKKSDHQAIQPLSFLRKLVLPVYGDSILKSDSVPYCKLYSSYADNEEIRCFTHTVIPLVDDVSMQFTSTAAIKPVVGADEINIPHFTFQCSAWDIVRLVSSETRPYPWRMPSILSLCSDDFMKGGPTKAQREYRDFNCSHDI